MSDQHEDDLVTLIELLIVAGQMMEAGARLGGRDAEFARLNLDKAKAKLLTRITDLNAEVGRWIKAYQIAHDQAMENGERAADLTRQLAGAREALREFAAMANEMERVAKQHNCKPTDIRRAARYSSCCMARAALNPEQVK